MPADGNKFKIDKNVPVVGKILSRKQKKRLEQIVEKKKKKENRAELLAALKSVQVCSFTISTFLFTTILMCRPTVLKVLRVYQVFKLKVLRSSLWRVEM